MPSSKSEKIEKLMSLTDFDKKDCVQALEDSDWGLDVAYSLLKKKNKKPKEKKVFKIGDILICIDNKLTKNIPEECIIFLNTYSYFKVQDVNEKLNIDIGYKLSTNGNPYYFSPNRFELKEGKAPVKRIGSPEEKIQENPDKEVKEEEKEETSKPAKWSKSGKIGRYEDMKRKIEDERKKEKEELVKDKDNEVNAKEWGDDWDFELMK